MEKILIIDDDPDVITVLQLLLKKKGYHVATASREGEAYEQVETFHPDLIVLDVLLSGVDGRDICKKLKTSENLKDIRIIMFSGHPGVQKNVWESGADDFMLKPFQNAKLLERIEAHLSNKKMSLQQSL